MTTRYAFGFAHVPVVSGPKPDGRSVAYWGVIFRTVRRLPLTQRHPNRFAVAVNGELSEPPSKLPTLGRTNCYSDDLDARRLKDVRAGAKARVTLVEYLGQGRTRPIARPLTLAVQPSGMPSSSEILKRLNCRSRPYKRPKHPKPR